MVIAEVLQELHERLLTLSLYSEEERQPRCDHVRATHRPSTDSRDATQNAHPVLWIESDIASEPLHVLSTVQSSRAVSGFFDDEELFFLQFVKESYIVGRHEELRILRIRLTGTEPIQNLDHDVDVKISVDFIEYCWNSFS